MSIQQQTNTLFKEQLNEWQLVKTNFDALSKVRTKHFTFDGFEIIVQFNPERIRSSNAKTDAKTIAERKCFLCEQNRPAEQRGVDLNNYTILLNPFPIFNPHYTIASKEHIDQKIITHFEDMLNIAESLPELAIFYNGPKCGASAPDHLHFQACQKTAFPLLNRTTENWIGEIKTIKNSSKEVQIKAFEEYYNSLSSEEAEPMMNIITYFENGSYTTVVIPRKAFRPWQFSAEGESQLMISPATVEVAGVFITPVQEHFEKITKSDIENIFEQILF